MSRFNNLFKNKQQTVANELYLKAPFITKNKTVLIGFTLFGATGSFRSTMFSDNFSLDIFNPEFAELFSDCIFIENKKAFYLKQGKFVQTSVSVDLATGEQLCKDLPNISIIKIETVWNYINQLITVWVNETKKQNQLLEKELIDLIEYYFEKIELCNYSMNSEQRIKAIWYDRNIMLPNGETLYKEENYEKRKLSYLEEQFDNFAKFNPEGSTFQIGEKLYLPIQTVAPTKKPTK